MSSNAWLPRDPDGAIVTVGAPPGLGSRRLAAARSAPSGPLFLVQGIAGLVLAVAVVAYPRTLTAAIAATYLLASVAALALSATRGFLGFMDSLDAPWAMPALLVEAAGALLLIAGGALAFRRR